MNFLSFFVTLRSRLKPTLAASALLALAACGGGVTTAISIIAGVGSGGTGFVTGFGSVIVDGIRYDDALLDESGRVQVEQADGTVTTGVLTDLGLGQRLQIQSNASDVLEQVQVQSEIVGPVEQTGTDFLVVAGQVVRENTQASLGSITYLAGVSALSDFREGDRVEVHGATVAGSNPAELRASRIELLPSVNASGNVVTSTKVTGVVNGLTQSSGRLNFSLGGLDVSLPATASRSPSGYTPANGELVKVFSTTEPSNGSLTASAIRLVGPSKDFGTYRAFGVVRSVNAQAKTFVLDNLTVDAAAINGNLPNVGVAVRVSGSLDSVSNVLLATRFEVSDDRIRLIELKGSITDYVSNASFRVRGIRVDASQVPGLGNLANGLFVEVKGRATDDVVIAQQVQSESPTAGDRLELSGTLSSLNTSAQTFVLRNTQVNYSNAKFENGSKASLSDGAVVEVKGRLSGSTLLATELELQQSENEFELEGVLRNNAAQQGNTLLFTVNGVQLRCTPDTDRLANCTTRELRAGVGVEVRYISQNGLNTATRIKIEDDRD